MSLTRALALTFAVLSSFTAYAQTTAPNTTSSTTPKGEISGSAWVHTAASLAASAQQAQVCLPAAAKNGAVFCGKWADAPTWNAAPVPVIVFMHGSSGLSLKAIGEWQLWLASLGWASVAPDSFALPHHVSYKSPIDQASYEKIHALRASEIAPTLTRLQQQNWADKSKLVLAGTSEGSVSVARYDGNAFVARIIYAWSCEDNYFVSAAKNALPQDQPVLNVISASDPYFSKTNTWLGNELATGNCAAALKDNPKAAVALLPGAPHTLLNLPATRMITAGFLATLTK